MVKNFPFHFQPATDITTSNAALAANNTLEIWWCKFYWYIKYFHVSTFLKRFMFCRSYSVTVHSASYPKTFRP
jgi:hypothetical protein